MFKRYILASTFIVAVGVASLGFSNKAMAWHDCGRDYVAAYPYAYPAYASYGSGWGPRVAYYPAAIPVRSYPVYYGRDYDRHHHHDHHHHNGVSVSFGF